MEYPTIEIPESPLLRTRPPKIERTLEAVTNPSSLISQLGGLSLYEFIQVFWNEISEDRFETNWHIPFLCQELEQVAERVGEGKAKEYDLIINIPPGTTKTIICSVMFPVWCWTKWYWMKFITGSYSNDLSLESAEKSRDIIRSDKFRMLYPDLVIKQDKDAKSNYRVVKEEYVHRGQVPRLHYGGGRVSTSVGGTITGFHGHINIWDDLINPKQAVSEVMLKTANDWMDQSASTRKASKKVSATILIMQRLHQQDPTGHLLEKKQKRLRHICLPGEIRNYRQYVRPLELVDNYTNDLLDVNRLGWEELTEMEADLGQYGYAGQVGQNPTPPGGGMFKVDHFQIISPSGVPAPVNYIQSIRYWDKAGSQGAGCYTAGVKITRYVGNRFVVEDVKRGQWGTDERERIIKETAQADGRDTIIYIEQEGGSGGKESAESTIRNLTGWVCVADHPTGDKVFRADPYSVSVNNGQVYLIQGDWNHAFVEEHRFFPFSTYKDQVDAAAGAYNKLAGKRMATNLLESNKRKK